MGPSITRTWYTRVLSFAVVIAAVPAVASPALAVDPPPDVDHPPMTLAGAIVENTDPDSPPLLSEGAPPELRAEAPLAALGVTSTAGPEDDLAAALDRLAGAAPPSEAQAEIALALAILDGTRVPGLADRAYEGIPLLNAGPAAAKVQDVPAGGTVEIREVRFGDQALLDTAGLRFLDPSAPFTIRWKITEVGVGFGRLFAPTALLSDGADRAGQYQALEPLGGAPAGIGRDQVSRFHPAPGAAQETRAGTRTIDVALPPARRRRGAARGHAHHRRRDAARRARAGDRRPERDARSRHLRADRPGSGRESCARRRPHRPAGARAADPRRPRGDGSGRRTRRGEDAGRGPPRARRPDALAPHGARRQRRAGRRSSGGPHEQRGVRLRRIAASAARRVDDRRGRQPRRRRAHTRRRRRRPPRADLRCARLGPLRP